MSAGIEELILEHTRLAIEIFKLKQKVLHAATTDEALCISIRINLLKNQIEDLRKKRYELVGQ